MRNGIRTGRERKNPIYWLFIAGFLLGVLVPNIMWKEVYSQANLVSAYLLECLGTLEEEKQELLFEVMQKRGGMAFLTAICGISIFGIPTAMFMILILAFELGSILTSSILQFGVQGGLLGCILLFPHGFLYIAGMFGLCTIAYRKSAETWNNQSIFNKGLWRYIGSIVVFLLFVFTGIVLEVYCSPEWTKIIIRNLEIFS